MQVNPSSQINDLRIRLLGIPAFGIIIPNITGLFGEIGLDDFMYWLGYLFFIFISFSIWQGNRWLLLKQREHFNWFNNPVRKVIMLLFANIFYTLPVTIVLCTLWYKMAGFSEINWEVVQKTTMMNVIAVIFVTHIYETVFLIRERGDDLLKFEQLERAKAQAELETLKTQIDPHFMFNSLNTLSYLISENKEKALHFNDSLADIYRYILINKDKELVQLEEEIQFVQNYYALLKIRFSEGIFLDLNLTFGQNKYLIPPISLQLLLENAVKHNEFDEENPLYISIQMENDILKISNSMRRKTTRVVSAGVGLKNLSERYRLIVGREIGIDSSNEFKVQLPLLKIAA